LNVASAGFGHLLCNSKIIRFVCFFHYLQVKPGNLQQDMFKRSKNPHVVLVTESRELHKEAAQNIRILLSSKRGYIFIQTDKPIYTPNSKG